MSELTKHEKRCVDSIAKSDMERLTLVSHHTNPMTVGGTDRFGIGHNEKVRQAALSKAYQHLVERHANWTLYMFMRDGEGEKRTRMTHRQFKGKRFGECFNELNGIANAMQVEFQIGVVDETAWVLYPATFDNDEKKDDAFSQICRYHEWQL